jgi:hypothetical protein
MGLRTWLGLKKRAVSLGYSRSEANLRFIEEGLIEPAFPIDVVYTWVDGDDPEFGSQLRHFLGAAEASGKNAFLTERWRNHDELKYGLRSVASFAQWVNHIYIVTNGQIPKWFAAHQKISIVTHDQILERKYLPTFNSHVIESALHRIPGLSEHYIYFNDDVMLLRPIEPNDLFTGNGLMYNFLSRERYPNGPATDEDLPSVQGAKNAMQLIHGQWGVWLDRRYKHTFHPLLKSVAEENERRFERQFSEFRQNKFRSINDILCCSVLHGNASYLTGRALFRRNRTRYVPVRNRRAAKLYEQTLAEKSTEQAVDTVCLNDAAVGDDVFPDYREALHRFLEAYFPAPSPFERANAQS